MSTIGVGFVVADCMVEVAISTDAVAVVVVDVGWSGCTQNLSYTSSPVVILVRSRLTSALFGYENIEPFTNSMVVSTPG